MTSEGVASSVVTDRCDKLSIGYDREEIPDKDEAKNSNEDENKMGGPVFFPPLYIQRYSFVGEILNKYQVTSVVDFGSSECKILRLLTEVPSLWSIILVDLDKQLLEANVMKIKPELFHFINKRDRQHPLLVKLFHGDATKSDPRILGCDALTMVEFIEHLYPADLEKVTKVVFFEVQPRVVIVTTPNFEFNELFPKDGRIFRHHDHKFEWTRIEFQTWGNDICLKYGYSVVYTGIGEGPPDAKHLGYCSQAAIFNRVKDRRNSINFDIPLRYTLIAESSFPYQEKMSTEETIATEINYYIREAQKSHPHDNIEDEDVTSVTNASTVIQLSKLLKYKPLSQICDMKSLREYLRSQNFTLTDDEEAIIVPVEQPDSSDDENYDTSDEDDRQSDDEPCREAYSDDIEEESWD